MGARAVRVGKIAALCAAGLLCLPSRSRGMDLSGRVTESVFLQTDDAASQNYNFYRTRLKLDATDVNGADNSLHFDGSNLGQGEHTYNSQVPANRVEVLNLRLERLFLDTDVVLGRQTVHGLVGAKVDGALLEHHFGERSGFGVFGGTLPDPYTDAFASSYPAYGGYAFYRGREAGLTAGYAASQYNGLEDQAYVFGSAYYSPGDSFSSNASARFDHALNGGDGYYVTNLLLSTNVNWGRQAYMNLAYNQYRAVWYQQSMTMAYGLNLDLQQSMRIYGDFSLSRSAKAYADYDYRQRESDGGVAQLWMLGFKDADLFGWLYYNAAYRSVDYFTARSSQVLLAVGAQVGERASGELGATYATNSQNSASNQMTQWIYSASANWLASKKLSLNCVVEASDQKFLSVDSVYLAKYKDEYLTTSVYANVSYRF